jgi:hypothetical protein
VKLTTYQKRRWRGLRGELTPTLIDKAFGLDTQGRLATQGVGRPDFPMHKRLARRTAGKRQRAARKANR